MLVLYALYGSRPQTYAEEIPYPLASGAEEIPCVRPARTLCPSFG